MLHGQEIHFVSLVDMKNESYKGLSTRIWNHEKLVNNLLLETKACLLGRKTYDITNWKGDNLWILTNDVNWKRVGVGTIHNIDDLHLHTEGPIYVLGGSSVFNLFLDYVDIIHLYTTQDNEGTEPWVDLDYYEWEPIECKVKNLWTHIKLKRIKS